MLRQFFAFRPSDGVLAVESRFALQWGGRRGPTITVPEGDEGRRAGFFYRISIWPVADGKEPRVGLGPLGADERLYGIWDIGTGYEVVVRRLGQRWYIRRMQVVAQV